MIIRPKALISLGEEAKWGGAVSALEGLKYDLLSFVGFMGNKKIQDKDPINCAEGVLMADQAIGLLSLHDGSFISPQSYWDFTVAGIFEIVGQTI